MNKYCIKSKIKRFSILFFIFISIFGGSILFLKHPQQYNNKSMLNNEENSPSSADSQPLFQGSAPPLNITDSALSKKNNQEINVNNQVATNVSYYLDDVHQWEANKLDLSINNVHDTREWVNGSDFYEIGAPYRKDLSPLLSNDDPPGNPDHNYSSDLSSDPTDPGNIHSTINEPGALAIRLHFDRIEIEANWDLLFIYNGDNVLEYCFTGMASNFTTAWIRADTLKITIDSDGTIQWHGYDIDYYEFYNSSSPGYLDYQKSWGYYNSSLSDNYGPANNSNSNYMYVSLVSDPYRTGASEDGPMGASYYENDYVELYQNISIPRGAVADGYISFSYYAESAMSSNENFIYCEINGQRIYSRGLGDIVGAGRRTWHHTGKIYMPIWINNSNIFDDLTKKVNISVGIMSGASVSYSGFDEQFQQIFWFDNISLVLTTIANTTQGDINLTFDNQSPNQKTSWGSANITLTSLWSIDPIEISIRTDSPHLSFFLNTTIYAEHLTTSRISSANEEGISYEIGRDGIITWTFYHNLFMPQNYIDNEFLIDKPRDWEILSVLDPTSLPVAFEGGKIGDDYVRINKTNASYPGWWKIQATSPNYISPENTKIFSSFSEWTDTSSFLSGQSTRIKSQINYSNVIPANPTIYPVNLTIYNPSGEIWWRDSNTPHSNGTVFFSEISFNPLNATGGQYNFTLLWSNNTALGGVKSYFTVIHESKLTLLKPDDAKIDLRTDAFVGDLIPIRLLLEDAENNESISNSIVSYNWTSGTKYLSEAALGIYETVIDTADLSSRGLYEVVINATKTGFLKDSITLEINLGEKTNLQILDSEYNIELYANSNIIFKFTDFNGDGINGALVNISITNQSYYSIYNPGMGEYRIEFSTLYLSQPGTYQLNFSFQATSYEPQYYTYQFQVEKQSVYMNVSINNDGIMENSPSQVTFYDKINITSNVFSQIDESAISGGNITLLIGDYEFNLAEIILTKYNLTMKCSPDIFSFGINYVYLRFEHQNYKTQTFGFQLLVDQIELEVQTLGFEGTYRIDIGETFTLRIQVLDPDTLEAIENASISYTWDYGYGNLVETSPGVYEASINLPESLQGDFEFEIIINTGESVYKLSRESFLLVIGEPGIPEFIIWIIAIASTIVISILGALSLRSYVIIPRKRKKEAELLARTQKYKDLDNIQAIVVIHRLSGIPLFSKSYSILEKQKKELFAGFVQAITTIGEEIAGNKQTKNGRQLKNRVQNLFELDFKYFHCLICDRDDMRIVLVLNEKSSEELKNNLLNLAAGITLNLNQLIENWDGSIETFEKKLPPIIGQYVDLYYKEAFTLNSVEYISKIRSKIELNKMEVRVLNTVYSIAKSKKFFYLSYILETVSEENKDLVIEAMESLIDKKIFISQSN